MEVVNKHKIGLTIWNGFTAEGKIRFNNLMDKALPHQNCLIHPMAFEMDEHHWKCLVYNLACLAAWNEFDLTYPMEPSTLYSAKEKLVRIPRHKDHLGQEEDCEKV